MTPSAPPPFWANLVSRAMVFPLSATGVDFHADLDLSEPLMEEEEMDVIDVRGRAFIGTIDAKRFPKVSPGELVVVIAKQYYPFDMFLVAKTKAEFLIGLAFAFDVIVLQGNFL